MTSPSLPQMVNRANDGHRQVLEYVASGRTSFSSFPISASTARGLNRCLGTLQGWGAVESTRTGPGEYTLSLTERGRALLEALR